MGVKLSYKTGIMLKLKGISVKMKEEIKMNKSKEYKTKNTHKRSNKMKRLERLEYLKTVKRAEIKELLKKARSISVPLEENEEYDNARTLQVEVEEEIFRLENITEKEYPRYNVLKNLEKHEIFKFFGNEYLC